jgi:hypothetical protein
VPKASITTIQGDAQLGLTAGASLLVEVSLAAGGWRLNCLRRPQVRAGDSIDRGARECWMAYGIALDPIASGSLLCDFNVAEKQTRFSCSMRQVAK